VSDVIKMNYADIDKVLTPWSKRLGLHVITKYRDEEVRSIDVVDDAGGRYSNMDLRIRAIREGYGFSMELQGQEESS